MEDGFQVLIHVKAFLSVVMHNVSSAGRMFQPAARKLLLVMCGGGLGAASRYGISLLAVKLWGMRFPWGTLMVNMAGCFMIGLLFSLGDRLRFLSPDMRLLIITGYLGALTTFSTFSLETVSAGRAGMMIQPMANILVNNVCGMGLTFFGLWLGGHIK